MLTKIKNKMTKLYLTLQDKKGEGYVDTGVKILIAVVVGSLLLTSLYGIINSDVIPEVKDKISEMFAYHV